MMVSSSPQLAPRRSVASHSTIGAPPSGATFFNLPSAQKPSHRPSRREERSTSALGSGQPDRVGAIEGAHVQVRATVSISGHEDDAGAVRREDDRRSDIGCQNAVGFQLDFELRGGSGSCGFGAFGPTQDRHDPATDRTRPGNKRAPCEMQRSLIGGPASRLRRRVWRCAGRIAGRSCLSSV